MSKRVRRDVAYCHVKLGETYCRREARFHRSYRLAIPLHEMAFGYPKPRPTTQMGKQPPGQRNRRLPFGASPFPNRKPVKNPGVQIDKRFAFRTERRSSGDSPSTSAGVTVMPPCGKPYLTASASRIGSSGWMLSLAACKFILLKCRSRPIGTACESCAAKA